jgi:predicted aspartyl protease
VLSEELGLPVIGKRLFSTAGGSAGLDECVGVVEVIGRQVHTHVLVSDELEVVLIGLTALEILSFEAYPVAGKLREGKVYLLRGRIAGDPLLLLWVFLFLCE